MVFATSQIDAKERLSSEQIKSCLVEVLSKEAEQAPYSLVRIVIHRDGRIYGCEIEGAKQAVDLLKTKGILPENAALTILEISKSAPVSLRLFSIVSSSAQIVNNPQIASYRIVGNDGYICATGRPFLRHGTVNPLHVRYVDGELAFESCLEDIFYLTALTWTKPDDCSRHPITTKLNDRRLREDANEYDEDSFQFSLPDDSDSEETSSGVVDAEQEEEIVP